MSDAERTTLTHELADARAEIARLRDQNAQLASDNDAPSRSRLRSRTARHVHGRAARRRRDVARSRELMAAVIVPERWGAGERFIAAHQDREIGEARTIRGEVLEVDELSDLARVRLDSGHETWLAVEVLQRAEGA